MPKGKKKNHKIESIAIIGAEETKKENKKINQSQERQDSLEAVIHRRASSA
jgi:hypothetical protein